MSNGSLSINKILSETNQKIEDFKEQVTKRPETISEAKVKGLISYLRNSKEAIIKLQKKMGAQPFFDETLAKKILDAIVFIQKEKVVQEKVGVVQAALAALEQWKTVLQNPVDEKGLKRGTKVAKLDSDEHSKR